MWHEQRLLTKPVWGFRDSETVEGRDATPMPITYTPEDQAMPAAPAGAGIGAVCSGIDISQLLTPGQAADIGGGMDRCPCWRSARARR